MQVSGKVALVTGGAHRVGRALALGLARAGADIAFSYLSAADAARDTLRDIRSLDRRARAVQADVTRPQGRIALIDAARDLGRLDILVNSAALFESRPILDIDEEEWDNVLDVNLKGPFFLAQKAVPLLRRDGGGVIVNIVDLSAVQPWPSYAHHAVSKAGLLHLTRILARALAPDIRANAIAPGAVLPPEDYSEEELQRTRDASVLRTLGSPQDVLEALLFLVRSDFTTGEVVVTDGGRLLR